MDQLRIASFPAKVDSRLPIAFVAIWKNVEGKATVMLEVEAPGGTVTSGRCSPLTGLHDVEIQYMSLDGWVFNEPGRHQVRLLLENQVMAQTELDLVLLPRIQMPERGLTA